MSRQDHSEDSDPNLPRARTVLSQGARIRASMKSILNKAAAPVLLLAAVLAVLVGFPTLVIMSDNSKARDACNKDTREVEDFVMIRKTPGGFDVYQTDANRTLHKRYFGGGPESLRFVIDVADGEPMRMETVKRLEEGYILVKCRNETTFHLRSPEDIK